MPDLTTLKENIEKMKIAPEIMAQMNFDPTVSGDYFGTVIAVLNKMDKLLTKEQRLALMEQEGCCKGGEYDEADIAFAKKYADKTLTEKTKLARTEFDVFPILNDDGTISGILYGHQNGVHTGKTTCSCNNIIRNVKDLSTITTTYCGCCAGNMLYHFQNALGVKLRLKDIVSSPLNTNGEKMCKFMYEVIDAR